MKIAVTYEDGSVFQHFGKTGFFKIYDVDTIHQAVVSSQVVSTNGSGHGALVDFLCSLDVDAVICGGIGGGAQDALSDAGIALYGGITGDTDTAVQQLMSGTLMYHTGISCNHHDAAHGEGHVCGEHGCGHHE